MKEYYMKNIEEETLKNKNFRKVLYTSENQQIVLMSLKPNEDIGNEIHKNIDQFIRIEKGNGKAIINNNNYKLINGSILIIPKGTEHNIINTGITDLKLYSIYSPPEHKNHLINKLKPSITTTKKNSKKFNIK